MRVWFKDRVRKCRVRTTSRFQGGERDLIEARTKEIFIKSSGVPVSHFQSINYIL